MSHDKIKAAIRERMARTGRAVHRRPSSGARRQPRRAAPLGRWRQRIPHASIRSAHRSELNTRGTTGVHVTNGRPLVNGGASGLVELVLDPPCTTDRTLSTAFVRARVHTVIVSLAEPDAFLAALGGG
jgi:hypothetical protein